MELQYGNFPRLDLLALTGRSRTHVQELPDMSCVLHPLAGQALLAMRQAAADAGLDLWPASCYRSFEQQLAIWNAKFRGQRPLLDRDEQPLDPASLDENALVESILLWSALPGASRHHWGTDFDVIDRAALADGARPRLRRDEYVRGGVFEALNDWLTEHAADFGFFRPYDQDRGGVQPEPWHLSFAPLSAPALQELTLDVLANALLGAELAGRTSVFTRLPEFHQRYVLAVAAPSARSLAAGSRISRAARPS
jgi:LAS superfamily LD-carboxypeptidase LdcB